MSRLLALIEREKTSSFSVKKLCSFVERNNVWIAFEGKLFNRNRLIEMICSRNSEANCQSDTEIVIELFLLEGVNTFALLEGYWSLIIIEQNQQKIYAARDFLGNNSLYYCQNDKQFVIASEISTLKNTGEINKNAIFDYLFCGDIFKHKQNFFSNIHEIKPSCYLVYSLIDNTFEEQSYYTLPYKNCKGGYNEYEEPFYTDKVRELIIKNISNNIEGNEKVAVGFNADIESFILLFCAKKFNPDCKITAFTSADLYDEKEIFWAEKMLKHTDIELINVSCSSQQLTQQLRKINKNQNIPVSNPNFIARHNLMATAKQHGFDVFIDYQGVDELFAGHNFYYLPFLQSLRSQWLFKDWAREFLKVNNVISRKKILYQRWESLVKKHYRKGKISTEKNKSKEFGFLSGEYKNNYYLCRNDNNKDKSVLNDYLYESYTNSLPNILRFGEHSAANLGVNYQNPFSNGKQLAEYVFSIPSTFKIHNGWNKYLLRASMIGIVDDEILWKKKNSVCNITENKWFNKIENELKEQIYQLNDSENVIDKTYLIDNWKKFYNDNNFYFQQFIFRYYSYLVWKNEFLEEIY